MQRSEEERVNWFTSIPFLAVHAVPLLAIFTGITWKAAFLCAALYWSRMFFITGGYHRYFSHRTYKLNRFWQFLLAFGGTTCAQKGPLWWAAHHRVHHQHTDTEADPHSPQKGFWWSHVGWILCDKHNETQYDRIRDFARFPELRLLNRYDWIGPWALAIASYLIAGWSGLVVGFFFSTILLWHATFTVNSLAHIFGWRRYRTDDTSRNNPVIAFITLGEGWHNNHHAYAPSARNGFFWWEYDVTYYILRGLSRLGIVNELRLPPHRVLRDGRSTLSAPLPDKFVPQRVDVHS